MADRRKESIDKSPVKKRRCNNRQAPHRRTQKDSRSCERLHRRNTSGAGQKFRRSPFDKRNVFMRNRKLERARSSLVLSVSVRKVPSGMGAIVRSNFQELTRNPLML